MSIENKRVRMFLLEGWYLGFWGKVVSRKEWRSELTREKSRVKKAIRNRGENRNSGTITYMEGGYWENSETTAELEPSEE